MSSTVPSGHDLFKPDDTARPREEAYGVLHINSDKKALKTPIRNIFVQGPAELQQVMTIMSPIFPGSSFAFTPYSSPENWSTFYNDSDLTDSPLKSIDTAPPSAKSSPTIIDDSSQQSASKHPASNVNANVFDEARFATMLATAVSAMKQNDDASIMSMTTTTTTSGETCKFQPLPKLRDVDNLSIQKYIIQYKAWFANLPIQPKNMTECDMDSPYERRLNAWIVMALLDEKTVPPSFINKFVGQASAAGQIGPDSDIVTDGLALWHQLIKELIPSQAVQALRAVNKLLSLVLGPDTDLSLFFSDALQIGSVLASFSMDKFLPLYVLSIMDPDRFPGTRANFFSGSERITNASLSELQKILEEEDSIKKQFDNPSGSPNQRSPLAQRAGTQGGGTTPTPAPTNNRTTRITDFDTPAHWTEWTTKIKSSECAKICPICCTKNPTQAQQHRDFGCELAARGGFVLKYDPVAAEAILRDAAARRPTSNNRRSNNRNNNSRARRTGSGNDGGGTPAPAPSTQASESDAAAGNSNSGNDNGTNNDGSTPGGRRATSSPPRNNAPSSRTATSYAAAATSNNRYPDREADSDDDFADDNFDGDRDMA